MLKARGELPAPWDREVLLALQVNKVTQDTKDLQANQDQSEKPGQQAFQVYQGNKALLVL